MTTLEHPCVTPRVIVGIQSTRMRATDTFSGCSLVGQHRTQRYTPSVRCGRTHRENLHAAVRIVWLAALDDFRNWLVRDVARRSSVP